MYICTVLWFTNPAYYACAVQLLGHVVPADVAYWVTFELISC